MEILLVVTPSYPFVIIFCKNIVLSDLTFNLIASTLHIIQFTMIIILWKQQQNYIMTNVDVPNLA